MDLRVLECKDATETNSPAYMRTLSQPDFSTFSFFAWPQVLFKNNPSLGDEVQLFFPDFFLFCSTVKPR